MKTRLLFAVALIFSIAVYSQTLVPAGNISGSWTIAGSPYLIMGETTIPNGQTLIIEPGILVEWQGSYTMFVQGRILAQGTETDSITFTVADTATGWKGIRFLYTPPENDTSIFNHCVFTYGNASGPYPDNFGGALCFIDFGKIIVDHCRFAFNKAIYQNIVKPGGGAAIALLRSSPVIRNSTFEYNKGCIGAALVLSTDSTLVENNVFRYNVAPYLPDDRAGHGGAILCKWWSHAVIRGNIFYGNHADRGCGAIFFWNNGNARVENNLFYENTADVFGGAMGIDSCSSPLLINNTIASNSASMQGGGIDTWTYGDPVIYNTILWGNTAPVGNQLYISTNDCSPDFYDSNIQGGQGAFGGFPFTGNYINCIDTSPLFSGNGSDPYSLSYISPCIDNGTSDTTGLSLMLWDILGNVRIWDGDGDGDTIIDMGAYEFGSVGVGKTEFRNSKIPKFQVEMWPNPVENEMVVSSSRMQSAIGRHMILTIIDLYSKEIRKLVKEMNSSGESMIRIDVSGLPPGVYLVKVHAGNESATAKIVKQ